MERIRIPDEEYQIRINNAAKLAGEMGLDMLIVNGNEADYGNVRYLSGFWPLFERCGIAISPSGKAAIMVGPESEYFAARFGRIEKIFILREYRESADPSYPELTVSTYRDVARWLGVSGEKLRIGVASWLDTNVIMFNGIKEAFPQAEIIRADSIMKTLRSVKSDNEIACIREAGRITTKAIQDAINAIRPGMTELQLVGIAQKSIYEQGAEYEGMPMYILSNLSTKFAVSRPTYNVFQKGDLIQLNLSAKVDGYSPSVGCPVCIGKLDGFKRELVEFCFEAHKWTEKSLRAGITASSVSKDFLQLFKDRGYEKNYLYGPCHGTGLIEVEAPWMETNSDYPLRPNMTFEIDTFAFGDDFGVRWEKPIAIKEGGVEVLGNFKEEIIELDF